MVLFKINGERNSGTNFLSLILIMNGFNVYDQKIDDNVVYHWKHGIPTNDNKKLDNTVVDLFVFRNLECWLISFSKNPYHLKMYDSFNEFLTLPQKSIEEEYVDYRTNQCLNDDDNDKTIFQIREYKFNKIIEYKNNNKDVVLLNLSYIQNENNLSHFLDYLSDKYMLHLKVNNYILQINHTKTNLNEKSKIYNINIDEYRDVINANKNVKIENFINNLTFI
jgi:hypothetical protein